MYFWKCWHDTRAAFFTFLATVLGVASLYHLAVRNMLPWSSGAIGTTDPVWQQTASSLLQSFLFLIPLAGFVLGALGVGSEFSKQTISFLLTRPRSRRYFLWSSWAVGACESAVLTAATILVLGTRPGETGAAATGYSGALLAQAFVLVSIISVFLYSLTFFFTVLFRKEQHGTNAAFGTVFVYSIVAIMLRIAYGIKIPLFWELYAGALRADVVFPAMKAASWLSLAILLAVFSHLLLEKAET